MTEYRPIGIVHSPLRTRGSPPFQSSFSRAEGTIEIYPEFRAGLRDLDAFSHIIVIAEFNQAERQALSEHPLLDGEAHHGIFACRHFNRPNPIGLSYAALREIRNGTLVVSGIDLLEGTPVLDIKPYIPAFDCIPGAGTGWVTQEHVDRLRAAGSGAGHQ